MRRLFAGIITLTFAAFLGHSAEGQIRLVPGPQRIVASAPKFITAADFNGDRVEDAAVTNSISNTVTVLLGATDAPAFGSVTTFNIGRTLRGLQAGDLNSDGIPDIAVVDFIDGKVFTATGVGNGTFNTPVPYKVGLYPFDTAIGNFDGTKGNDLAVVDQGINKVSVLLNQGGNTGFGTSRFDFTVGSKPKRGVTGDFNGDHLDDIVTVNTGTAAADNISLLLNNGIGGFLTPARNFVVGAQAQDVAVADLNDDGVPDLAVLNAGLATQQTSFSISILINQTQVVNGKPVGQGLFNSNPAVQLNCPTTINGVPINCHPSFIAAGDFDNDGFTDLAVTVATQPKDNTSSIQTSGLVVAFKGNGDGTFDFSNQVTVGLNPQGIVAGDFNGDGIPDLCIAETGSFSVRILTALAPPPIDIGGSCHLGHQCVAPEACVDGTCCSTATCPTGQFCDIPGSEGTCSPPNPIPHTCSDGHQCESQFCVDGFCCNNPTCPSGQFCNNPDGMCHPPADNGIPCNSTDPAGGDDQCLSTFCTDGVCCDEDRCPADQTCNVPGFEGSCMAKLGQGSACTSDAQCATTFCTEGFCCGSRTCPTTPGPQSCAIPGKEGFCSLAPTPTPTVTATPTFTLTPTRTLTPTPQPIGLPCSVGAQCVAPHACVNNTCCSSTSCPSVQGTPQRCDISDAPGTCLPVKGQGDSCGGDTDCGSGNCDTGSSTCQGTRTPTPTPTAKPGDACNSNANCPANFPCNTQDGVCCNFAVCPTGQACNTASNPGFCTTLPTPTRTATPLGIPGSTCDTADNCEPDLFCTDGVCCTSDSPCPAGERCDITGLAGSCSLPLDAGSACNKNTDCNALLECIHGICAVPEPTPTFAPPTPTLGQGFTATTSSGGGCSINHGADGNAAWLLAALPLIFGARRYRLQRAHSRRIRTVR